MIITPGINSTILNSKAFENLPNFDINYEFKAKVFNQEGDLKYEYNPFRNLRAADGQLKDLRTQDLGFNLNSPVDITVQPSYDGTVNLILNDDRNPPRMINSRFTPIEDKRYKIIDRKGNNDTNVYDESTIKQTVRLFKTTEKIPYIKFNGLVEGGQLKSGNYVFYFKYADADGNESDIVTESGIISCYIGKVNDPTTIRGGLANELTNKIAKLTLCNLDTSYDYINIYYTRSTGSYEETEITELYKISNKKILSSDTVDITITGLEAVESLSLDALNIQYNIVDKVKSQTQIQNMLFFGNVDKPTIPYAELEDLSLRIYPTVSNDNNIGYLDHNYESLELENSLRKSEYYDAVNVYKYTGYWNKEMYRMGVVYILKDDSLSPVFNIRGKNGVGAFLRAGTFAQDISTIYTHKPVKDAQGKRVYVDADEEGFITSSEYNLENTRGIIRILYGDEIINKGDSTGVYPLSVNFNIEKTVIDELAKHAKGFFFVRQKRIPTIIAQGITIGVDNVSHLPAIYAEAVNASGVRTKGHIAETFMDKGNQLVHNFQSRLLIDQTANVSTGGLLCPEAVLRSEYFNEIFTGALFNVSQATFSPTDNFFTQSPEKINHFYVRDYVNKGAPEYLYKDVKLTLVEDNQSLRYSGTKQFSTRAGVGEEAWRFAWFGKEDKGRYATNLIRGAYSGFVGMENYNTKTSIIDIHVPGFDPSNMRDYFLLRANSFNPFYSMSDRYDLTLLPSVVKKYENLSSQLDNYRFSEYRGDCFISNYTTRIVRNFQDTDSPINDTIINPSTWRSNYEGYTASGGLDKEKIAKINRSDVNAIKIGHWATFKICSNINLAYRSVDESNVLEFATSGKARSFYPYAAMSVTGESKIPESTVVNVGYNSTTSDKIYLTSPDVPYIKNIFDNRIMFSEIHINDAFRNGYRVFQGLSYKDITRQYGAIVKVFEWRGNLLVVFENGVGVMAINERAMAGDGTGGGIFIRGAGVLSETVQPLSTNFGSAWKDSIIQTERYIYGVDTIGKKIWRTDGESFEIISDFKIQKFLNDNITLGESEKTPMIALRNVKTHYNAFKQDVMFTFYDTTRENEEVIWNLCFNEQLNKWVTRYSWTPVASASINNVYFSFDRESAKKISLLGYTLDSSDTAEGITLTSINVTSPGAHKIADIKLKGYNYYSKYTQVFSLDAGVQDNDYFKIQNSELHFKGGLSSFPKYAFNLKIRVGLGNLDGLIFTELQSFYDFVSVKVDRTKIAVENRIAYDEEFSTYFWKHGQAGIFDISTPILPSKWYDKQEVFEYEFIVVDNPNFQKIYDNLVILSNNAEPNSFEFEVVGDGYDISKSSLLNSTNIDNSQITLLTSNNITTYQKAKDIKQFGRMRGNMHYKEDMWDIEIKPHRFTSDGKTKEARIRDKYCKIRVRYSGEKLAIITALQTIYTQSYA